MKLFGIRYVKINPLRTASALFLVLSPFLTWITIVSVVIYQNAIVFGMAAQSNLFQVSSRQLGTNISNVAESAAAASIILLVIGGLFMLKSARVGVPVATMGLVAYLLPIYPIFGAGTSGLQDTFISPGIGVFSAMVGIALGAISPLSKAETFRNVFDGVMTKRGLSNLGVFLSTVALVLDLSNHTALGQFEDFIGSGLAEQVLHVGLIVGISSALIVVAVGSRIPRERLLFGVALVSLALLGIDATYNILNSTLNEFLGHNLTETFLHFSVYYGLALITISGFLQRE